MHQLHCCIRMVLVGWALRDKDVGDDIRGAWWDAKEMGNSVSVCVLNAVTIKSNTLGISNLN